MDKEKASKVAEFETKMQEMVEKLNLNESATMIHDFDTRLKKIEKTSNKLTEKANMQEDHHTKL